MQYKFDRGQCREGNKNMIGTIKRWDVQRGFGFVAATNGRDYFLHIKNWNESGAPAVGTQVEFEIGPGARERKEQAINARLVSCDAGVNALRAAKTLIAGIEVMTTTQAGVR
jgi:cold shock CspA family protein